MNIFVLDTDPIIAAQSHCDQHIHKMILESAQMLSTFVQTSKYYSEQEKRYFYKAAYEKHPCTEWVGKSLSNAKWICDMCTDLDVIRQNAGCNEHQSMTIIKAFEDIVLYHDRWLAPPKSFVFAGPFEYKIRHDLTVVQRYQAYYRYKQRRWLDTLRPMSYANRSIPSFLQDVIKHG